MPPADTPDFDSMSPEEVMAWLETLAKRQGAYEGFTTAADVDVPEIDPSTVTIDEPGYVPYGETPPARPARPAPPPARVEPPAPPRVEATPPPPPRVEVPPARPVEPARLPFEDEEQETQPAPAGQAAQGLAWLESLAADQGGDFPQIDLSSLTTEPAAPAASSMPANPLDWLESLAEGQEAAAPAAPPPAPEPASVEDPLAAGVDPMLWLESLARRQGARPEELTTRADMPVPTAPPPAPAPQQPAADPAAWLESLASDAGFDEEEADDSGSMSDDAVKQALQTGAQIPNDAMAAFLDRQLARQIDAGELSAQALDEDEEAAEPAFDFDPDAPPIPGDIPDWLMAQVQMPSGIETPEKPPLVEEIIEPPAVQDLPDWLRDDFVEENMPGLEDIFAAEERAQAAASAEFIDPSDPWVEAFEQEAQMPDVDSGVLPDWYTDNINDPARQAAVDRQARGEPDLEALPPEPHLAPGEPEAVPEWAAADVTEIADIEAEAIPDWLQDQAAATADVSDWLGEMADVEVTDIPDWLRATLETDDSARVEAVQPVAPVPAYQPPAPVPAAAPAAAAAIDVDAVLSSARASARAGDVSAGLADYEKIIRANTGLDAVVEDLTRLVEQHDDNPAVYRVLGDGLMRQGRLQAALDTYRRALNQL